MASVSTARGVSFAFFIVAFCTFVVSFGSPYWYCTALRNEGLWLTCVTVREATDCTTIIKDNSDPWMRGFQAMMTMALFWQTFSLIAYVVWLKKDDKMMDKLGLTVDGRMALVFSCLSGLFITVGLISYVSMFDSRSVSSLCWAFFAAVIAGILELLVGSITLASVGCKRPEDIPAGDFQLSENAYT